MEIEFSRPEFSVLFDNKDICEKLCRGLNLPHVESYACIDQNAGSQKIITQYLNQSENAKLILKPVASGGGKGIKLVYMEAQKVFVRDGKNRYDLNELKIDQPYLLQNYIDQHKVLNRIYPGSVNTVRVLTVLNRDKQAMVVLGTFKSGIGEAYIDNNSLGGVTVKINKDTGMLVGNGVDLDNTHYYAHPDTGAKFDGFKLPIWKEVIDLSIETQEKLPYSRILGLDIAFTQKSPVIVEINDRPDTSAEEQVHGPLFEIPGVWKIFKDNNLLINNPSKILNINSVDKVSG